ncbi:MAG: type II toxin-antitoxin system VapC family toxin [Bacteroidetes bacterium]|nr:type II toxin-antitoxin system VapC family toxin [Bacteroidota bacterium]
MAAEIFLDANVLVDYALRREHFDDASAVIDLIVNHGVKGYISSSVLHITGYWLTKDRGSDKVKEFLLLLLNDIEVIDIPHEIAVLAVSSQFKDIEDAIQYYTALHHKLDYFISNDRRLKKDSLPLLPVLTPKEFLASV